MENTRNKAFYLFVKTARAKLKEKSKGMDEHANY